MYPIYEFIYLRDGINLILYKIILKKLKKNIKNYKIIKMTFQINYKLPFNFETVRLIIIF